MSGCCIPDDAIIEYSHLSKKAELAKRIRMITGVEQSPEQMEMSAMQQQLAMQELQLGIEKIGAEIQKLQSEAAVNMAEVQDTAEIAPQLKMMELQSEMRQKEMELQLRRELADLTNQTRVSNQETSAATQIAKTAMQQTNKTNQG